MPLGSRLRVSFKQKFLARELVSLPAMQGTSKICLENRFTW